MGHIRSPILIITLNSFIRTSVSMSSIESDRRIIPILTILIWILNARSRRESSKLGPLASLILLEFSSLPCWRCQRRLSYVKLKFGGVEICARHCDFASNLTMFCISPGAEMRIT